VEWQGSSKSLIAYQSYLANRQHTVLQLYFPCCHLLALTKGTRLLVAVQDSFP
jgi:hypothetical protein